MVGSINIAPHQGAFSFTLLKVSFGVFSLYEKIRIYRTKLSTANKTCRTSLAKVTHAFLRKAGS